MRITIDTTQKTIELKDPINFIEFIDKIKKFLSEKELKEYTIKPKDNTIYYQPYVQVPYVSTGELYNPPFTVTCSTGVGVTETDLINVK